MLASVAGILLYSLIHSQFTLQETASLADNSFVTRILLIRRNVPMPKLPTCLALLFGLLLGGSLAASALGE